MLGCIIALELIKGGFMKTFFLALAFVVLIMTGSGCLMLPAQVIYTEQTRYTYYIPRNGEMVPVYSYNSYYDRYNQPPPIVTYQELHLGGDQRGDEGWEKSLKIS